MAGSWIYVYMSISFCFDHKPDVRTWYKYICFQSNFKRLFCWSKLSYYIKWNESSHQREKMFKICIEKWCITFDANFDWEVLEKELSNAGMIVTCKKDITLCLSFLQVIRFFSISWKLLASSHKQKIYFLWAS